MRWARGIAAIIFLVVLAAPVARAAEPVHIRLMDFQLTVEPTLGGMKALIAEFEKEFPNIKVDQEPTSLGQVSVRYVTQARAGQPPDVVRAQDYWVGGWYQQGFLLNLDKYVKEAGGQKYLDNFYKAPMATGTYSGGVYGIPAWSTVTVLVYNKEIFKDAGVPMLDPVKPITWPQFLDIAKKVTDPAKGRWGYGLTGSSQASAVVRFLTWLFNNGTNVLTADYTKSVLDEPKAIESLTYWSELYTKYKVVPGGVTEVEADAARTLIAQERVAMIQSPVQALNEIIVKNPKVEPKLALAPMPTQLGKSYTPQFSTLWTISKASKQPDAAWKFVEFMSRKESQVNYQNITRMTPARRDALLSPEVQADITGKVAAGLADNIIPFPPIPQWSEITQIVGEQMQKPLVGAASPVDSFKEAARRVNALLKR
jgi:ABC-type glycerol-3-phosphate transport system substrate-binding protein